MVSRPKPLRKGLRQDLTHAYGAFDVSAEETFCGMAFLAGSGPSDKHCSACRWFFDRSGRSGRCAQFPRLNQGRAADRFPGYARACRYFAET
jgi:hypothetical protein